VDGIQQFWHAIKVRIAVRSSGFTGTFILDLDARNVSRICPTNAEKLWVVVSSPVGSITGQSNESVEGKLTLERSVLCLLEESAVQDEDNSFREKGKYEMVGMVLHKDKWLTE